MTDNPTCSLLPGRVHPDRHKVVREQEQNCHSLLGHTSTVFRIANYSFSRGAWDGAKRRMFSQTFKINTEERCTVLQHLATGIYLFRLIVENHEEAFCRSALLSGRRYLPYVSSVSIASCHSLSILKISTATFKDSNNIAKRPRTAAAIYLTASPLLPGNQG
ncbi:hypothetical protein M430DRAFT_210169 [Amorphotheca resinae ATCC 22711]|jgi:hypothetical protein|uniref:Uncharacterized protein n=1 Tax=Amorphotheca resinae ATCC 22711 TaxID=857342 RepID=A0A2T3B7M9_AMORE|nr:hypothetical protein M430DRAFT_210169 [Amorphotheca resinae ATCC 22711]PSS22842.1 hypothetical protein M430DRAFT_210169 [Amorphotheca resinae ATCC 22711]